MQTLRTNRILSGMKIKQLSDILPCIQRLHQQYEIKCVFITSIRLPELGSTMRCTASIQKPNGEIASLYLDMPVIEGAFRGTGDLYAALTMAYLYRTRAVQTADTSQLAHVLECVLATMRAIILDTRKTFQALSGQQRGTLTHIDISAYSELRIIQNQQHILRPNIEYRAKPI